MAKPATGGIQRPGEATRSRKSGGIASGYPGGTGHLHVAAGNRSAQLRSLWTHSAARQDRWRCPGLWTGAGALQLGGWNVPNSVRAIARRIKDLSRLRPLA